MCLAASWAYALTPQLRAANDIKVIRIELQNLPNNMEPVEQPAAVRVDNRAPFVTISILNLSPLDACSITRTPAPVTETNPFQALLTSVATFGSVGILGSPTPIVGSMGSTLNFAPAGSTGSISFLTDLAEKKNDFFQLRMKDLNEAIEKSTAPPPASTKIEDDAVYKRFVQATSEYPEKSRKTSQALAAEQTKYDTAAATLLVYVSKDYRGQLWTNFAPRKSESLPGVAELVNTPLASAGEIATVQSDLDLLTGWQAYLVKNFQEKDGQFAAADVALEFVNNKVDAIKAAVSLLTDAHTALKTSQTALRAAYLTALRLSDDFHRRQGESLSPDRIQYFRDTSITPTLSLTEYHTLEQDIRLGSDRKNTVTGAVTCVSQTDLKTPTTDTPSNYSLLYQDSVPLVSLSLGTLVTLQPKVVIGTENAAANTAGPMFAVTDRERAQIFPMAFLNFHTGGRLSAAKTCELGKDKGK